MLMRNLLLLGLLGAAFISCEKEPMDVVTVVDKPDDVVVVTPPSNTNTSTNDNTTTNNSFSIKSISIDDPSAKTSKDVSNDLILSINGSNYNAKFDGFEEFTTDGLGNQIVNRRYDLVTPFNTNSLMIQFFITQSTGNPNKVELIFLKNGDGSAGATGASTTGWLWLQATDQQGTFESGETETGFIGFYTGEATILENTVTDQEVNSVIDLGFEIHVSHDANGNATVGQPFNAPEGAKLIDCAGTNYAKTNDVYALGQIDCGITIEIGAQVYYDQNTVILGGASLNIIEPANGGASTDYVEFIGVDQQIFEQLVALVQAGGFDGVVVFQNGGGK